MRGIRNKPFEIVRVDDRKSIEDHDGGAAALGCGGLFARDAQAKQHRLSMIDVGIAVDIIVRSHGEMLLFMVAV
jgi:hypothetical protein